LIVLIMSFVTHNEELHQLDRTVGVLFLGYVVTMALYGFNAYQVYIYFSTLQGEHYLKRVSFPKSSPAVESPTKIEKVDNGLAVFMILIVQLCVYTPAFRNLETLNFHYQVLCSTNSSLAQLDDFDFMAEGSLKASVITGSCQGLTLTAGLITVGMLYLHHNPSKSTSVDESSTMPYDNLVDLVWERGVAGTVIQFAYFVVFLSSPSDRFWMPFQLTARRAFMLGLVTLYINRDSTPISTNNAFRARKGNLSTTTEFSTLGDTSADTETATKNNPENIFRIDVTKTIEHNPPFGDYKKPLETQDSE
ncbi:hypothetical protein F5146DRAFT_1043282, partial [Armillaria mellea]